VACDKTPCDPLIADGVLYPAAARVGDGAAADAGIFAIPLVGNAAIPGQMP
jgi:hypothetical protein